MTQDEQAIRQLVDRWMTASKAGNLATMPGLMADDMIFLVPGQRPMANGGRRATPTW